jgi:hypothetical protein
LITQATKKFNTRWQGWARKRNRPGSPQTSQQAKLGYTWGLRQRMWTQERIALHLGISQPAVAQILKRLTARYKEKNIAEIEQIK